MKLDLDEQDLALLHGMQIAPRVSWSAAASILGSTPATIAARWDRLRSDGLAWVTAHPAGATLVVSLVEVDCRPESRAEVVRAVCADPRAATVEESARDRDLLLTVMTPDLPELTRFALDELSRIPGVQRTRTHLTTAIHWQGSSWRLDALDPRQRAGFERVAAEAAAVPDTGPPPDAWLLIEALAHDGRASAADLARLTGRNAATVRRQLPRLIASGLLAFRCEVAQVPSQWPISCTFVGRVPAPEHARTAAALATLAELRLCVSTTGSSNFMFTVWVRSLQRLLELERLLAEKLPWLGIVESAVTLRTPKRMGWMLDDRGRATGEVIPATGLRAAGRRGQVAFTRRSAT
ncbi:MAG TPA: Lrp/AsnC ligand binding domain-containing protein [Pseudonocardia sp.]|nr:Lrp/AsnC ligand binding domain-containing protein [Pseudonocardia sp.]